MSHPLLKLQGSSVGLDIIEAANVILSIVRKIHSNEKLNMKKLKLILLIQALILGALTLNAEDCPCEGGTAPYSVDCDGDGTMDACDTSDCPPCSEQNPDPSEGMDCCGDQEFDPNDFCCDDSENLIDKNNPEPAPTITGPNGGTNMVNKSATVPAPKFSVAFVGTTPVTVDPHCGELTYIYERTIITPTNHVINNISKENRWTTSGTTGDAGSCGIGLNLTVQTGAPVSVTVGGGISIPPVSFSVSSPIQIQAATSVNCNASAENYRWHYYEIFKHQAKLSGGTSIVTYNKTFERQYRYCSDQTMWSAHGTPQNGLTTSTSANVSTSWSSTNTEYCDTDSNSCCPN